MVTSRPDTAWRVAVSRKHLGAANWNLTPQKGYLFLLHAILQESNVNYKNFTQYHLNLHCKPLTRDESIVATDGLMGRWLEESPHDLKFCTCPVYISSAIKMETPSLVKSAPKHGEKDIVASAKRFVNIATANQNCWGDNFICYGNNCNCGSNLYCCCNNWHCYHSNSGLLEAILIERFAKATKSFSPWSRVKMVGVSV